MDRNIQETARYRIFNIIEAFIKKEVKCNLITSSSAATDINNALNNSDIFIMVRSKDSTKNRYILDCLKKNKTPIVYDIDDLIIDKEGINFDNQHVHSDEKIKKKYQDLCEKSIKIFTECDFTTVSTDYLANAITQKGKQAFVIKNTINYSQVKLAQTFDKKKKNNTTIKIGYFSGTFTHKYDFMECKQTILKILQEYDNIEFHAVGAIKLDSDFDKLQNKIIKVPMLNYLNYLEYLANMDINLAPLAVSSFNHAKSELKIFEAGLVGVPTIASGTDSYKNCIKHGENGFIATNNDEWHKYLSLLIGNSSKRLQVGEKAKEDFLKIFYIENVVNDIISTYENIITSYKKAQDMPIKITRVKINPMDNYISLCDSMNLIYTTDDLQNLNFVPLFYKPDQTINDYFTNKMLKSIEVQKKIEEFVKKHKDKKICLYGASLFLNNISKCYDLSALNIVGIIDKNEKKWGQTCDNYTIFSPDKINELNPDVILNIIINHDVLGDIQNLISFYGIKAEIVDGIFTHYPD
jgi:glycosyltransferase involved in cell wall biosynthesis